GLEMREDVPGDGGGLRPRLRARLSRGGVEQRAPYVFRKARRLPVAPEVGDEQGAQLRHRAPVGQAVAHERAETIERIVLAGVAPLQPRADALRVRDHVHLELVQRVDELAQWRYAGPGQRQLARESIPLLPSGGPVRGVSSPRIPGSGDEPQVEAQLVGS